MTDPIVWWEPERLRSIGLILTISGASILATHPLADIGMGDRQRFFVAVSLTMGGYYVLSQSPRLASLVTAVSVALAVLVPVVLRVRVIRDILSP